MFTLFWLLLVISGTVVAQWFLVWNSTNRSVTVSFVSAWTSFWQDNASPHTSRNAMSGHRRSNGNAPVIITEFANLAQQLQTIWHPGTLLVALMTTCLQALITLKLSNSGINHSLVLTVESVFRLSMFITSIHVLSLINNSSMTHLYLCFDYTR